jgi:hypothetical protein
MLPCIPLLTSSVSALCLLSVLQHKIRVGAPELDKLPGRDPTLIATAYKKQRLYLFTRREPADAEDATVSMLGGTLGL